MTGFSQVPLAEVLDLLPTGRLIQQGWSPQCHAKTRGNEAEWAVLTTTAIQEGRYQPAEHKLLPSALAPRPELEVQPGDLLLTSAGPRRRCAIPCLVRATPGRLLLSGKMYRFRALPSTILPEFLELYLLSPEAQKSLEQMKTGISDSGLNLTHERFLALSVPCPSLDEQRRIVAILEDHLSRLDAANSLLGMVRRRLESLRATSLESLLERGKSPVMKLGELARSSGYGTSTKCVENGAGVPVVRIPNLVSGRVDLTDEKRVQDKAIGVRGFMLEPGDLLIVRTNGSRSLIGRTAVVQSGVEAAFASYLIRFRLDRTRVTPEWIHLVMNAPSSRRALERMAASSAGQYNLGLSKLASVDVPVPSLARQEALVAEAGDIEDAIARTEQAIALQLGRGDIFRRALLAYAFSGQLSTSPSKNASLVPQFEGAVR